MKVLVAILASIFFTDAAFCQYDSVDHILVGYVFLSDATLSPNEIFAIISKG
jgi:hypothetical protein